MGYKGVVNNLQGGGVSVLSANHLAVTADFTSATWSAAVVQILRNLASLYAGKATSIQVFEYRKQYSDRAAQYTMLADTFVKSTPAVWSGLVGWNSVNSAGEAPGHMFGKAQWGANPDDWSE